MSVALDFMHSNGEALMTDSAGTSNCNSANGRLINDGKNCPKDYVIQKATAADFKNIHEFMLKDFLFTEPLNEALDVRHEDAVDFFAEIIQNNLDDGLSYVVREKLPNETLGRVVAIRLSSILDRPAHKTRNGTAEKASAFAGTRISKDSKMHKIESFLEAIESQAWNLLPYKRLMTIVILSVDQKFTRRGIAGQLINQNLDEVRAAGCQGIMTEATAFNSQQLFAKHGYRRLYEIRHADWLDADGQRIFRCKDWTKSATLEFLPL